ncbi:MAG: TIGR00159 family protein [Planctomycetes bacterium]|nr:TIGR00159 family protein [Planctomycetota bacterium]
MTDKIKIAVEIGIFFFFFYALLLSFKGTRGAGIFKGVIFISFATFFLIGAGANYFELSNISFALFQWLLPLFALALIIVFQPELRRVLMDLGQSSRLFNAVSTSVGAEMIDSVASAAVNLSGRKHGALIALEKEIGLKPYIEGGIKMDSQVTKELIETIFYPGSELHDGGLVIKDERIIAAGCVFPLTENPNIPKSLGTRHRAAIGLTEESDAITVVVSEETGKISVSIHGQIESDLDKEKLVRFINENYRK